MFIFLHFYLFLAICFVLFNYICNILYFILEQVHLFVDLGGVGVQPQSEASYRQLRSAVSGRAMYTTELYRAHGDGKEAAHFSNDRMHTTVRKLKKQAGAYQDRRIMVLFEKQCF